MSYATIQNKQNVRPLNGLLTLLICSASLLFVDLHAKLIKNTLHDIIKQPTTSV